jgi:hydroxylamine reductase (hybrid-cluster protein)
MLWLLESPANLRRASICDCRVARSGGQEDGVAGNMNDHIVVARFDSKELAGHAADSFKD